MKFANLNKFSTLFSLYIAQSIPMSFFFTVVPVIMRQENYSLESIGMLQILKLPWIFKFLWAPLVDNSVRSKKQLTQWIIVSELFYATLIVAISFFHLQTDFATIVVLMIFALIASATQDIATDIFAIKILKPEEKGVGNSVQSGGSFIGTLFGTGILLLAYHYFGWQNLLLMLAVFVLAALLPLLFYKPGIKFEKDRLRPVKTIDIFKFFKDVKNRKNLLVLLFYYSGLIGILAMLKPYLVDLGYNVKEIGFMSGIVGTGVAACCALSAGFIIKKIGRQATLYTFAFINLCAGLFFLFISTHTPSIFEIYVAICMLWGAYGLSTVIIYTTSMDAVRKNCEGTDFTLQIVISHLSGMLIAIFSGRVGDYLGYSGIFGMEVALSIVSILILLYVHPIQRFRKQKKIVDE